MICIGIDVAKDKHDCFIISSEGVVLADVFTIPNDMTGFNCLLQRIQACSAGQDRIKVGLEATGHYSYNILRFLLDNGLDSFVINPLHTNLYRKSLSLRKTKTDRVDARTIAMMLMSDVDLKPYTDTAYHNEELKSLTRYRFDKVRERAQLKQSVARLACILFPELEKLVPTLHMASVYALLEELPGAHQVASAHLTHLKTVLRDASKGRYSRDKAIELREAAKASIGSRMPAKSLELRHTIRLIRELDAEIVEIESAIQHIMDEIHSPITTIPGIGFRMGAMILAETGDFSRFDSPDKVLAYAGLSPSTYQSGQLVNGYAHMEKRGSKYLRFAIFNATKYVCHWDPTFAAYLAKKRAEGKHYNVAISHAAKKLVRLIYAMEKSGEPYHQAA
jgi:transposase